MKNVFFAFLITIASALHGFSQNAVTYTYEFIAFNPLDTAGLNYITLGDDDLDTASIGFTFGFYDKADTVFTISSNGFLTFSPNVQGCCNGQNIPDATPPNDLIAFAWEDLNPGLSGIIGYKTSGIAPNRMLQVDFIDVPHFPDSSKDVTTQILLYEGSNIIEIHTTNMSSDGGNHTMGVENVDGTIATVVNGRNRSDWSAANEGIRFIPTESTGIISGYIYNNLDTNCSVDSSDVPLPNHLVKLQSPQLLAYTTTDSNGLYSFAVDTGDYLISWIPNNTLPVTQTPCTDTSYNVNIALPYDTASGNDFGMAFDATLFGCSNSLLFVDLVTYGLRRCPTHDHAYIVNYCNSGWFMVDSVYVTVAVDNFLDIMGSVPPWTSQNGNTYTFLIDTLTPHECGSLRILYRIPCDAVLGQTFCTEAKIFSNSACENIDSTWDKSSVAVEGSCVGDSLACFTIYNTGDPGTGDMTGTSEYSIYENNVLVDTGTFQIAGGDSVIICRPANGNTIRLEADQRPGHPGNSHPQDNVELCGDSTGNFVTGQIILVPEDDEDYNIDIDCREVTGSFDPNEKLVKPVGITANKYISADDVLEYQVNFQNTGTDTAFKVVIRDTLSSYLDLASVISGASSHEYSFRIYGQGILEWTFDDIMLPDSNVNDSASHGFVKFKVAQQPNNAKGTVITNSADIYFDFNPPVITEEVVNVVYDTVLTPGVSVPKLYADDVSIMVYPNPFSFTTIFEITGLKQDEPVTIQLFNVIGVKVKETGPIANEKYVLNRGKLNSGIYIYQIRSRAHIIGIGKLIIE